MDTEPQNRTYSIQLRVRRITCEDAYISVPVTDKIMKKQADGIVQTDSSGNAGVDFELLTAEAMRISQDARVEWKVESSKTEPHPIQQPRPEGRKSLDAFYDQPAAPRP